MTLLEFLTARLDEDEAVARQAIQAERPGTHWRWFDSETDAPAQLDGNYEVVGLRTMEEYPASLGPLPAFIASRVEVEDPEQAGSFRHIARWDPARVLAEVEAKRRIVTDYLEVDQEVVETGYIPSAENALYRCLLSLSVPYADHPDYAPAWRP